MEGLLFLSRPAHWVLPFTAPPSLHSQPSSSCELLQKGRCEEALGATYPSNLPGWHPQAEAQLTVILSPAFALMCVPHGLEGQVEGEERWLGSVVSSPI